MASGVHKTRDNIKRATALFTFSGNGCIYIQDVGKNALLEILIGIMRLPVTAADNTQYMVDPYGNNNIPTKLLITALRLCPNIRYVYVHVCGAKLPVQTFLAGLAQYIVKDHVAIISVGTNAVYPDGCKRVYRFDRMLGPNPRGASIDKEMVLSSNALFGPLGELHGELKEIIFSIVPIIPISYNYVLVSK